MTRMGRPADSTADATVSERDAGAVITHAEFERLFSAASRRLWTVAAAVLGRPDRADDVLQESAVIALSKLHVFERETSFTAWMSQIVRNVARNELRRHVRDSSTLADPQAMDQRESRERRPVEVNIDQGGHVRDARGGDQRAFDDQVLKALDRLDDTPRACLLLRTLQDMPYKEIAQVLEIPEGTAMSHVHRARRALRSMLAGDATAGCIRRGAVQ